MYKALGLDEFPRFGRRVHHDDRGASRAASPGAELVLRGDRESAVSTLDSALDALDGERLLTTTEAADLLGVRSVNTLKLLLRAEGVPTVRRGNRTMVALGEVERLRGGERARDLRASDRLHDASAALGEETISPETLEVIAAGRPGTSPWER